MKELAVDQPRSAVRSMAKNRWESFEEGKKKVYDEASTPVLQGQPLAGGMEARSQKIEADKKSNIRGSH